MARHPQHSTLTHNQGGGRLRSTGRISPRRAALALAGAVCIFGSAVACANPFGGGNNATEIRPSQYQVLGLGENDNIVTTSGTIGAGKTVTVQTSLETNVESVDVRVGDRVQAQQHLLTLSTHELNKQVSELEAKQQEESAAAAAALHGAQREYQNFKNQMDQGFNPELTGARRALQAANRQYDQAVQDLQLRQKQSAKEQDKSLRDSAMAVDNARSQVLGAVIDATRAGAQSAVAVLPDPASEQPASIKGTIEDTAGRLGAHLGTVQSFDNLDKAYAALRQQEADYRDALDKVDPSLVEAQRAVEAAFNAKADATRDLEAARLGVQQQLQNLNDGVQQASEAAQRAAAGQERERNKLAVDVTSTDVRAPIEGTVVAVGAQEGRKPEGALVTIAEKNNLLIRSSVKELDVSKLKLNSPVEFTTQSTGSKVFKGTLTYISPVAESAQNKAEKGDTMSGGPTSEAAQFPIEITVNEGLDELLIGSSAKARITMSSDNQDQEVPTSAVFTTDEGASAVLVVTNEEGQPRTVEVRKVATTKVDDDTVRIKGDVAGGDTILLDAEQMRDRVGTEVTLGSDDSDAADK